MQKSLLSGIPEPIAPNPDVAENKGITKTPIFDGCKYGTDYLPYPIDELAQAWDDLSPEVKAALTAFIEQITFTARSQRST